SVTTTLPLRERTAVVAHSRLSTDSRWPLRRSSSSIGLQRSTSAVNSSLLRDAIFSWLPYARHRYFMRCLFRDGERLVVVRRPRDSTNGRRKPRPPGRGRDLSPGRARPTRRAMSLLRSLSPEVARLVDRVRSAVLHVQTLRAGRRARGGGSAVLVTPHGF